MAKRNLYDEIVRCLNKHQKTLNDILHVYIDGCYRFEISNFLDVSKSINYDAGWGLPEIATGLVIVGEDFMLKRKEYDGREWFIYISYIIPEKVELAKKELIHLYHD